MNIRSASVLAQISCTGLALLSGCSPAESPATPKKQSSPVVVSPKTETPPPVAKKNNPIAPNLPKPATEQPPRRTDLAGLIAQADSVTPPPKLDPLRFPPPAVNETLCVTRSIRKITGKHLVLYTDLPEQPAVDELPAIFDAAVPLWAKYFEVPLEQTQKWKMVASLAKHKESFRETGLWDGTVPPFLHGYAQGSQFWMYEQNSDYYRRHLVLHEGTHAFMQTFLGNFGPPWYAEGTAELLGTHRWKQGQLTLGVMPNTRDEFPLWGRIKLIREGYARKQGLALTEIMNYSNQAHLQTEPYAWCWAAAYFCEHDPDLQKAFRELRTSLSESSPAFATRFWNNISVSPEAMQEQWQVFIANMDYGYDFSREKIVRRPTKPIPAGENVFTLKCDQGWQSTGWELEVGKRYQIQASGRYQIALEKQPWLSEAEGVTIRYNQGQPLGKLLAAVTNEGRTPGPSPLLNPIAVGAQGELLSDHSGILYFRINDRPQTLSDNLGELTIQVREK